LFSPCSFALLFALVFVALLPLGIGVIVSSSKVVQYSKSYAECKASECFVTFEVTEDMEEPVFLYYELTEMYRNHRLYVKSRSNEQLAGEDLSKSEISETCENIQEVKDLWAYSGSSVAASLGPEAVANPCGLIANSFFNDSFSFVQPAIEMRRHGISWYEDDSRYEKLENWRSKQWTNVEAEDFSVWMRASATTTSKRLYGVVEQTLKPGNYTVKAINRYADVTKWGGDKRLVLSTSSAFGGTNYLLGSLLVAISCIAFLELLLVLLCFRQPSRSPYFADLDCSAHPILNTKPEDGSPGERRVLDPS